MASRSKFGVIGAMLLLALGACNAPREPKEETRMFPKAPLQVMAPIIKPEPTTRISRLATLNRPPVVLIPAESTAAAPKK